MEENPLEGIGINCKIEAIGQLKYGDIFMVQGSSTPMMVVRSEYNRNDMTHRIRHMDMLSGDLSTRNYPYLLQIVMLRVQKEVVNPSSVPVEQEVDEEDNIVPDLTVMTRAELYEYQTLHRGPELRRIRQEWERRDAETARRVQSAEEDAALSDLLNGNSTHMDFSDSYLEMLNAGQLRQIILASTVQDECKLRARRLYNMREYRPRLRER